MNAKSFGKFCDELIARKLDIRWFGNARADNLTDLNFVKRLRASGCWMLAMGIESASDETRKDMVKKLEEKKIELAFKHLRQTGIKSFAFFIFGYPGESVKTMEQTTEYAISLDPDFANFYPAVPYPGTALYDKSVKEGLLVREDWSRMEYSYYLLQGNGLNEEVVMSAINRAKRRFFLRPKYIARHMGDVTRLLTTKPHVVSDVITKFLFGGATTDATPPAPANPNPVGLQRTWRTAISAPSAVGRALIGLLPRMLAAVAVEIVDLAEVAGRFAPVHLALPGRAIGEFVGHFDDRPGAAADDQLQTNLEAAGLDADVFGGVAPDQEVAGRRVARGGQRAREQAREARHRAPHQRPVVDAAAGNVAAGDHQIGLIPIQRIEHPRQHGGRMAQVRVHHPEYAAARGRESVDHRRPQPQLAGSMDDPHG